MRNVLYKVSAITKYNHNYIWYFRTYHDALIKFGRLSNPYMCIEKLVNNKVVCLKKEKYN